MKNSVFLKRLAWAASGIRQTWKSENSFRTQLLFAAAWLIVLALLGAGAIWWAMFLCIIAMILALELINTALENLADFLHPNQHPMIKLVKDCAAGAVLILSLCSVAMAAIFLVDRFRL